MSSLGELRAIGKRWEWNFCLLAARYEREVTPHQLPITDGAACSYWEDADGTRHRQLLPDIVVWSSPGEHHEIKHKERMDNGCYGYEAYRLHHLVRFAHVTGQPVYYTVHDWRLAGAQAASEPVPNCIEHWFCAEVRTLERSHSGSFYGPSLIGGVRKENVFQYRWNADTYFRPLADLWAG